MTDQQFDKFFRDSFRDHQSPVPDDMWSRIHPEEEKRRRVFFIPKWYALVAVLLLMAGGYFTWQLVQEGKTTDAVAKTENTNKLQEERDATQQAGTNNNKKLNEVANGDKEPEATTALADEQIKQGIAKSGEAHQKVRPTGNNKDDVAGENRLAANIQQSETNSTKGNNSERANNGVKNEGEIANQRVAPDKNVFNNTTNEKTNNVTAITKGNDVVIADSNKASVTAATAQNKETRTSLNNKQLNKNNKRGITIEAYASPELALKTTSVNYTSYIAASSAISDNQNYLEESYKTQQDKVYKKRVSYSAGLRIAIPVTKKFSLKTGLQYSQINEKFDFEANDEQRDYALITARYFNAGNGTFLPIFDTTSFIASGFHKKITYNKYRSLNIPVLVSYETGNNNITWGATAGAVININSWYTGDMLSAEFKAASIKSQNIYKHNTGVSLYAGVQVAKRLNTQWQVFAEPHLQYALSDFTNSKAYVQQKFSTVGLAVGLRYNLSAIRQHK